VDQTRIRSWTDTGGGVTTTRTHHYDGTGDNPAWAEENTTGPEAERYYTRNVGGIGGDLSVIHHSATGTSFQVANPHGDVVGTSGADGTLTSANGTADEYGTPRDTATIGTRRYGWLGAKQRAADTPGGLTLMGVRLYNPTTGRFLSVDPIAGGNANPYEYCSGDPVNCVDLDGRWSWRKAGKRAVRWGKGLGLGGSACLGVFTGGCASISVNRYDGFTFTSGWTGRGRPGKRRVYYGISAGPAFSYQKRSVGNGWCGSVAMVGRCRDSKGNRQWWVNTPSKYMGAGVVSNRTRWQWRPWR
jgi:RHS repeat-associated protein